MNYVARCEQCGVIKSGDLEAVGDAAEDHEQFHDVRIQRVAADGGQDVRSEWTLVCTDCDWEVEFIVNGHPREGPPSEVEDRVRKHKGTVDWSHVVRVKGRIADEDREIDPSLLTDGGQSLDGTDHWDFAKGFRCSDCSGDLRVTGRGSDDTSLWEEHECVDCGGEGSYYNSHSRHTPQITGVTERVYNLTTDGGQL